MKTITNILATVLILAALATYIVADIALSLSLSGWWVALTLPMTIAGAYWTWQTLDTLALIWTPKTERV